MGMSSSQARLLSLTARLSDLEYSAQSISNGKIRLADQSEDASKKYMEALDKQKTTVLNPDTLGYVDATAYNLTTYNAVSSTDKQRFIKDSSNKVLVTSNIASAYNSANGNLSTFLSAVQTSVGASNYNASYYTNVFNEIRESGGYNSPGEDNMRNSEWLQAQIEAGNIYLYTYNSNGGTEGTGDFVNVPWTSGDLSLRTVSDNTETAKAEAEYETTLANIQSKDKRFDLELKEIDTEHTAIQTEIDSVKKVIDKNIERSFKVFDA